jgi:choline transporter-like protein 2/4/5
MDCCVKYTRCCLACFERFIRFITKNAFIMMAITGEGFCTSAHQAFYLILRSSAQYAITHGVGHLIMFFGKLLITITCTFCGYLLITNIEAFSENIFSPFMPTLVILN